MGTLKLAVQYHSEDLERDEIIRLSQVRVYMDLARLQHLANTIAKHGLIGPSVVVKLKGEKELLQYLQDWKKLSPRTYKKFDEHVPGKEWYYVLCAGHRRDLALGILKTTGCTQCIAEARKKGKELGPNGCYYSHFGKHTVEVRVVERITAQQAKFIQNAENSYEEPTAVDLAYSWREHFLSIRRFDPDFTPTDFAEMIGFATDRVTKALEFCLLPAKIRHAVEKGHIPYTNAIEFRRLLMYIRSVYKKRGKQTHAIQSELYRRIRSVTHRELTYMITTPGLTCKKYQERVSGLISTASEEDNFFGLMCEATSYKVMRGVLKEANDFHFQKHSRLIKKVAQALADDEMGIGKKLSGIAPAKAIKQGYVDGAILIPGLEVPKEVKKLNLEKPRKKVVRLKAS